MRFSSLLFPGLFQVGLRAICSLALVAGSVPTTANLPFLSKPSEEWTEAEALQVLNNSPWAHTITTATQNTQCNYEHPVFAGLFSEEMAQRIDSISPSFPSEQVKPDGAEYLVRLVSVKPMQAATERLISLDEKWAHYRIGVGLEPGSKPTNMVEHLYNPADEITIVVTLMRPGPGGTSFLDYAFEDRKTSVALKVHYMWACAGVRTGKGQTHAVLARMGHGNDNRASAIVMSFPSIVEGKPLISHPGEKLEFRFILNQRVFETTFSVNPTDMFDGSETVMHIPSRVDDPTPAPLAGQGVRE
jgi:hypothetical protein